MTERVHVAAAILEEGDACLIARRRPGGRIGGLWEFPGGKVEPGESPQEAVARELHEEFGIRVAVGEFVGVSDYDYEALGIRLTAYRTRKLAGELTLHDHEEIRWVTPDELARYELAPADLPIAHTLMARASAAVRERSGGARSDASLRFRCLLIDHDDTAVDSTSSIHHPAHVEMLRKLRPTARPISLDEWYLKNFDPGVMGYLVGELGMTPEELAEEFRIWREFTNSRVPHFYPGVLDVLGEFKARGGILAVVSHSEAALIERDYRERSGGSVIPDAIFGWEHDETRRKPSPWPVEEVLRRFALLPEQALILDDLKPAVLMGEASRVAVAGVGWSHHVPQIRAYMRSHCVAYLESVAELRAFLFA